MLPSRIRQRLIVEAQRYTDRDAYISDYALSSIWGDDPGAPVPQHRLDLLTHIYDTQHATLTDLLSRYQMSQTDFARYFDIPVRTVQQWAALEHRCPPYVLAMAAEILSCGDAPKPTQNV